MAGIGLEPRKQATVESKTTEFIDHPRVIHFIECLGRVKINDIYLLSLVGGFAGCIYNLDELSSAGFPGGKSMLTAIYYVL
jgi:hypothetical protein